MTTTAKSTIGHPPLQIGVANATTAIASPVTAPTTRNATAKRSLLERCVDSPEVTATTRLGQDGRSGCCSTICLGPVKRAKLVAVRIADVGQVHRTQSALTQTRSAFDRDATVRNRRIVELVHLLGRTALETYRGTVGGRCCLAIDWFADAESSALASVEKPSVPSARHVAERLSDSKYTEHGVIEPS
jgi:hypothetical protein